VGGGRPPLRPAAVGACPGDAAAAAAAPPRSAPLPSSSRKPLGPFASSRPGGPTLNCRPNQGHKMRTSAPFVAVLDLRRTSGRFAPPPTGFAVPRSSRAYLALNLSAPSSLRRALGAALADYWRVTPACRPGVGVWPVTRRRRQSFALTFTALGEEQIVVGIARRCCSCSALSRSACYWPLGLPALACTAPDIREISLCVVEFSVEVLGPRFIAACRVPWSPSPEAGLLA